MVNAYYFIKASYTAGFFVPLKHSTPLNIVGYFIFFYFDVGGKKFFFFAYQQSCGVNIFLTYILYMPLLNIVGVWNRTLKHSRGLGLIYNYSKLGFRLAYLK